jgi:hypothetical protein
VYDYPISTTGVGVVALQINTSPQGLLLPSRLTAYQALADEVRLDQCSLTLIPILGKSVGGRVTVYIERNLGMGPVATVDLANDQREVVASSLRNVINIKWSIQSPFDKSFNALNPGSTAMCRFFVVGDNLQSDAGVAVPNATQIFTARLVSNWTVRGRP